MDKLINNKYVDIVYWV